MIRTAIVLLALAGVAVADSETDADRAFRAAMQRAVANDPAAVDAFEAIGGAQPQTRWTDDAWAEAARLAERAGDLPRARRDLERVIAVGTDEQLVRRARAALERMSVTTGDGRWDAVTIAHERLVADVFDGGDPRDALAQLESLVTTNPSYPRATAMRLSIARGWEQEGHQDRALRWLREAVDAAPTQPGQYARLELVRALLRAGDLDTVDRELAAAAAQDTVDRAALADVREDYATAARRARVRQVMWLVLALLFATAVVGLRKAEGSWKAAARAVRRPPMEVIYMLPIAAVLIVTSLTGNPLVAGSVRVIVISGLVVCWISGVMLEGARGRGGLRWPRVLAQIAAAVVAVGAATYLAIDRDGVIDLVLETWRGGPAMR